LVFIKYFSLIFIPPKLEITIFGPYHSSLNKYYLFIKDFRFFSETLYVDIISFILVETLNMVHSTCLQRMNR